MELILKKDLAKELPLDVEFNFDDIKAWLNTQLERYRDLYVAEDAVTEAKGDRAALNKIIASLKAGMKNVKAKYLAPYSDFEAKMKELIAMAEEPCRAIDEQLKAYEARRIDERKHDVEALFDTLAGEDLSGLVQLQSIFDSKWENKTCTLKQVEAAMAERLGGIRAEIKTIDSLIASNDALAAHRAAALNLIFEGRGATAAIAAMNAEVEREKRIAEHDARMREREREAKEAAAVETVKAEREVAKEPERQEPKQEQTPPKLYSYVLELTGTYEQLTELRAYMAERGITYTKH